MVPPAVLGSRSVLRRPEDAEAVVHCCPRTLDRRGQH